MFVYSDSFKDKVAVMSSHPEIQCRDKLQISDGTELELSVTEQQIKCLY